MSLVFFFLRNVPISGLCLPKVGEGEEGEEREEEEEKADNTEGGSPLSVGSKKRQRQKVTHEKTIQNILAWKCSRIMSG